MAPQQYQTVNEVHDNVPASRPLSWELDLFVVNRLLDVAVQLLAEPLVRIESLDRPGGAAEPGRRLP